MVTLKYIRKTVIVSEMKLSDCVVLKQDSISVRRALLFLVYILIIVVTGCTALISRFKGDKWFEVPWKSLLSKRLLQLIQLIYKLMSICDHTLFYGHKIAEFSFKTRIKITH